MCNEITGSLLCPELMKDAISTVVDELEADWHCFTIKTHCYLSDSLSCVYFYTLKRKVTLLGLLRFEERGRVTICEF